MKKWIPWLVVGVFALWALAALAPRPETGFRASEFGKIPVLLGGRIQPLDSVARNALLQMRGKQTAPVKLHFSIFDASKRGQSMSASAWLLEVFFKPEIADTRRVFRIDHPDLITSLKLPEQNEDAGEDGKHYSWNQIEPALEFMQRESDRIFEREQKKEADVSQRSAFERAVMKLQNALVIYRRLKNTAQPENVQDFAQVISDYQKSLLPGITALGDQQAGKPADTNALERLAGYLEEWRRMDHIAYPLVVPPPHPEMDRDAWTNVGDALFEPMRRSPIPPAVAAFGAMSKAYRDNQPAAFNQAVTEYRASLEPKLAREEAKGRSESFFNGYAFFYKALTIYTLAFLLACGSWFVWSEPLRRSAYYLIALGFLIHTVGLIYRMVLEGRPPVTNLYSSAIFIGWGVVLFCLILERIFPLAIAAAVAALGGFVTLIIAHNLALGGDTMEMLQAVLDTNFWLATHVVVVTLGYASTFLAGTLAVFYIVLGLFTDKLRRPMTQGTALAVSMAAGAVGGKEAGIKAAITTRKAVGVEATSKVLTKMVYGIICFATLFSFVGTVLGGIWADQSWGRFWGWDVKENGALIIVLWNALILHARWGGLVRERGLMNLAIFGNIVTSFSWFGVNMLGVGLHSYGFMEAAFKWLMLFMASQLLLIALGLLPEQYWRSFRKPPGSTGIRPASGGSPQLAPVGK